MIWVRIFSQWPPRPPPQLQLQGDHSSHTFQTQSCLGHSLDERKKIDQIFKSQFSKKPICTCWWCWWQIVLKHMVPTSQKKNTWQSFHTTRVDTHTHTKLRFWDAFSFQLPLVDNDLFDWTQESPAITLQYVSRNSEDTVRKMIEITSFNIMKHEHVQVVQSHPPKTPLLHLLAHEICFILLRSMLTFWHHLPIKKQPIHQAFMTRKPVHHGMAWLLPGNLRNPDLQWNVPCGVIRAGSEVQVYQGPNSQGLKV